MSFAGSPTMAVNFTIKSYNQGQTIFREGQEGSYACIINSGRVAVVKNLAGRKVTLAVLERGEVFGEMALIATEKRTASVVALDYTEVVVVDRERLLASLKSSTPLAQSLIVGLIKRLAHTSSLARKDLDDSEQMMGMANLLQAWTEPQKKDAEGRVHLPYLKLLDYTKATLSIPAPRVEEILEHLAESDLLELGRGRKGRELVLSKPDNLVARTEAAAKKLAPKGEAAQVRQQVEAALEDNDEPSPPQDSGLLDLTEMAKATGLSTTEMLERLSQHEAPESLVYFSRKKALQWAREIKGGDAGEVAQPREHAPGLEELLNSERVVLQKALAGLGFDRLVLLLRGASPEARVILLSNISPRLVGELPDITGMEPVEEDQFQDTVRMLAEELKKAKLDLGQ